MQRDFRQYVYAANINVGGLVYSHWKEANPALSLSGMWREDCQPDIQLLTHLGAQNQDIKSALTVVRCQRGAHSYPGCHPDREAGLGGGGTKRCPVLPSWLDRAQQGALLLLILLFSAGYATVGVFMLLLTVIAEGITLRRLPWARSRIDGLIVALLLLFLLSGWFSPYRPTALGSLGLAALTIYLGYGPLSRQLRRHPWFLSALIGGPLVPLGWYS